MPIFNGSLNTNKIYNGTIANAIFNMIISQTVYDLNVTPNTQLLDMFKEEVGGYGDKKLFYFTDVLKSRDFIAGIETTNQNVLETHRPKDITVQEIVLDNVRQVEVTVDDFLVKQGFQTEGAYSQLMSVFQSALEKTKQIHLAQTVNTFIGTDKNAVPATDGDKYVNGTYSITISDDTNKEAMGAEIAEGIANLLTALSDISREYTDDKYLRSFSADQLVVVWNAKYSNLIQKRVLPFLFGPDKLTNGIKFDNVVLPARYFGSVSAATSSVENARTLKEIEIAGKNYFPGDVLPTSSTVAENSTYVVDDKVICKVVAKDAIKMLTAYNTTESFRNARAHNTNYYMCFGYSTPEHLVDFPVIEVKQA